MGESPSARTERELADLRRKIDADVEALIERAKADIDPRNLLRRLPHSLLRRCLPPGRQPSPSGNR